MNMGIDLRVVDEKNQIVAEGPVWDERENLLYTIDILGRTVRTTNLKTLSHTEIRYDQDIGCVVLRENGGLLAAMTDGIYELFPDGSKRLFCAPGTMKGRRFNDGKVGPDGRFYVGTVDDGHEGALYRVDPDGTMTELVSHLGCSNGLAWTSDGRTMYFVDSPDKALEAFDFDREKGLLSRRRIIMPLHTDTGVYDGMTIDEEDKLWVAVWEGGCACRIDPETRAVLETVKLPADIVSCCAFGGEDLKTLIITTGSKNIDLAKQPQAGQTFACRCEVPGRPAWRFRG